MARIKHLVYRYHLFAYIVLLGLVVYLFFYGVFDAATFLSLSGGLTAFVYFVQKQQLEELRLFHDLFGEFNERYDKLNEALNRIIQNPDDKPLQAEEVDTLYNYFNLCSEEYLYYKRGYIGPDVWEAWKNGMDIFFKNQRVAKLWQDEIKSNSYYGFEGEFPSVLQ